MGMAQQTLEQILASVGAYVDDDTTLPEGTEETNRINLVNQALSEWGNAYQWKQLRIQSSLPVTFSATSFALPTNFKKLMSPIVDVTQNIENEFIEVPPQDRFSRASLNRNTTQTDRFVFVIGDDAVGRALVISPPQASGPSLLFDYQAFPSSMATLQDISVCPHPEFIVKRTIGLVLEIRSDTRFPQIKADADTLLARMIEEEQAPSLGENNRTPDWARKSDFSIGFDS